MQDQAFAEVIESSLTFFKAQSWKWDKSPQFGSLVKIESKERSIFAIVHHIQTGPIDSHRTVITYKKTEEELKLEQPHIFEFLQTSFECLTLGYFQDNKFLYQLAPEPPKIHAFVYQTTKEEIAQFFSNEQYLHILFNFSSKILSLDELLLSLLKSLSDQKILDQRKLECFIQNYSLLTANDYRRLKLFLQRATPIIKLDF
jgi:hypothetical protein